MMVRLALVFLALGTLFGSGCVAPVFHQPTSISTKSIAARQAKLLRPVRAESTSYGFVLIPIPSDPRDIYEKLLTEARAAGGNAVVDVQLRSKTFFLLMFPLIVVDTWEAEGMAAVIGGSGGSGSSGSAVDPGR
ncbi:MAG: hypothetical protein ACYTGW_01130 [Planctomycetota bacterium]|jgi:uncharacterized protein YbjQ (UPF0145 family)